MPALVVPNAMLVRWIWQASTTDFAVNVMFFKRPPGTVFNSALATQIGTSATNAYTTSTIAGLQGNTVRLNRVTVRDVNTANQPEYSAVINATGTGTSELLPKQISLVATLRTLLAGRSYRGRVYVPGFTEVANSAGGVASATAVANAQSLVDAFRVNMLGDGYTMGVVSRYADKALRPVPIITDVTAVVVRDATWDNQRRRNIPGIGA